MPGPQSFNDTASVNGKVSGGGASYPTYASTGGGSSIPSAVQQNAGTENDRAAEKTLQAGMPSGANSGPDKSPAQKFGGGSV